MPDKIQEPLAKDLPHPMQPIGWDGHGVIRFKRNAIVDALLDECTALGGIDLNDIAVRVQTGGFPIEDQIQLAQLIGYSVSGFGDLHYVPEEISAKADDEADRIAGRNNSGLRERCADVVAHNSWAKDEAESTDYLMAFVATEIGRSAITKFEKSAPLCLYFEDDASREEFIEAFKEAKPNVVTRKLP